MIIRDWAIFYLLQIFERIQSPEANPFSTLKFISNIFIMSKLVVESSQIGWPIDSIPPDLRRSRQASEFNPEESCKVQKFIDTTLKDNLDWKKHLNHECWCSICTCGRHMCKLHRLKPLGKHLLSDYKINFKKHPRVVTSPSILQESFSPSKGVVLESTYHAEYQPKDSANKHIKKEAADNLRVGGPFFVGTTYKQEYYPKVSTNIGQIPMLNSNIFAMNVPLNAKSSYHDNYRKHPNILTESFKPNPRFNKSVSLDYVKGTTYKDYFKLPAIDAYQKRYQPYKAKNEGSEDHINKKSTYQVEYVKNHLDVCPAVSEMKKKRVTTGDEK